MYLKPCVVASILFATPAIAQVSVQEYTVPRGHGIHDVWAVSVVGLAMIFLQLI